jgi:hypothetical protein
VVAQKKFGNHCLYSAYDHTHVQSGARQSHGLAREHLQSEGLALHHGWQSIVRVILLIVIIPIIIIGIIIVRFLFAVRSAETCNKPQDTFSTAEGQWITVHLSLDAALVTHQATTNQQGQERSQKCPTNNLLEDLKKSKEICQEK